MQLSTHWCYLHAALPRDAPCPPFDGPNGSKTCIGKGMNYPRHIRLLLIQDAEAPKRHFRRSHPDRCSLALGATTLGKAQIHVGPLSNWNRQTAVLWEAIGPLRDSSEWHEGGLDRHSLSANRTGKGAPANTGQAARRCAIDSSAPDEVSKKEFC